MFKKAVFVLGSALLVMTIAGCDNSTTPEVTGEGAVELPPGMKPNEQPAPGSIPTVERPGSAHSKTTSSGE